MPKSAEPLPVIAADLRPSAQRSLIRFEFGMPGENDRFEIVVVNADLADTRPAKLLAGN